MLVLLRLGWVPLRAAVMGYPLMVEMEMKMKMKVRTTMKVKMLTVCWTKCDQDATWEGSLLARQT